WLAPWAIVLRTSGATCYRLLFIIHDLEVGINDFAVAFALLLGPFLFRRGLRGRFRAGGRRLGAGLIDFLGELVRGRLQLAHRPVQFVLDIAAVFQQLAHFLDGGVGVVAGAGRKFRLMFAHKFLGLVAKL